MDTSRVDGVKAPQHRGTPRSHHVVVALLIKKIIEFDDVRVVHAPQHGDLLVQRVDVLLLELAVLGDAFYRNFRAFVARREDDSRERSRAQLLVI